MMGTREPPTLPPPPAEVDLDRDYGSYFHFQVDQRGCVAEDCWGDRSWDPRWYVAATSDETGWHLRHYALFQTRVRLTRKDSRDEKNSPF